MSTTTDTIIWGTPYDLSAVAQDDAGDPITMDGTWSAACRISKGRIGGEKLIDVSMSISEGAAVGSIETSGPEWAPGVYYYDIRLTDGDGTDYWTAPVKLVLTNRNTPPS